MYGTNTVLPAELSIPSARMALVVESTKETRKADLEALEERRNMAAQMQEKYWVARYYKSVVARTFAVCDLVWKSTMAVMRNLETPKFTPR